MGRAIAQAEPLPRMRCCPVLLLVVTTLVFAHAADECGPFEKCPPPPPGANASLVHNECCLTVNGSTRPSRCALVCLPHQSPSGCPPGSRCAAIQGVGLCVPQDGQLLASLVHVAP